MYIHLKCTLFTIKPTFFTRAAQRSRWWYSCCQMCH